MQDQTYASRSEPTKNNSKSDPTNGRSTFGYIALYAAVICVLYIATIAFDMYGGLSLIGAIVAVKVFGEVFRKLPTVVL